MNLVFCISETVTCYRIENTSRYTDFLLKRQKNFKEHRATFNPDKLYEISLRGSIMLMVPLFAHNIFCNYPAKSQ